MSNTRIFLCSRSLVPSCEWVAVWGILKIGAAVASNGVPGTIVYSMADRRSPRIPCLPPTNIVLMVVPLTYHFPKMSLTIVIFGSVVFFGTSQYRYITCTSAYVYVSMVGLGSLIGYLEDLINV